MLNIVTALITAQLHIASLQAQNAAMEARPPEIVTEHVTEYVTEYVPEYVYITEYVTAQADPETRECGMCGAHVVEWHYVASQADGQLFEACDDCYKIVENES